VQCIRHESYKDVSFNPFFLLVMDGPKSQIPFHIFEGFFYLNQLYVEFPHLGRVTTDEICPKQVAPLAPANPSQFVPAQRELQRLVLLGNIDLYKPPG
jgi:hypothetical protein